ncbi:MAG TPA: chlorite dismutase family protein [Polyangiaceae bacterium]
MTSHPSPPEVAEAAVDVQERGAPKNGVPQVLDRRLFMQLLVFAYEGELAPSEVVRRLKGALAEQGARTVLYEDVNHPSGFGLLSWSEDPADLVTKTRPAVIGSGLSGLRLRPEFTMLGRSYSSGFEDNLEFWLIDRPAKTVTNPDWPWAIWYPLRRIGAFEKLESREKGSIMREHAVIGKRYGNSDLAHDVRLACHGLDANDNEFIIGLIGKDLHPLSHVIQTMRGTRQTSEYIGQMGPFFVGRALHAR